MMCVSADRRNSRNVINLSTCLTISFSTNRSLRPPLYTPHLALVSPTTSWNIPTSWHRPVHSTMASTMPLPSRKKGLKIKRALKSAARLRLPSRVSEGRGSGRNKLAPLAGERPFVLLRVQIIGCQNLLSKDRSGTSDP